MHTFLSNHPGTFFPARPQEIHYFAHEDNFRRGEAWYRSHFRAWKGERIIGQTSPLCLFAPRAARRIGDAIPDVKLIFVLRNPVDRAYSHYWHEVRLGRETLPFADALAAEPSRTASSWHQWRHFSYRARGRYAEQLHPFVETFGPSNILVLVSERVFGSPRAELGRCLDFLGLEPEEGIQLTHRNATLRPRSLLLQRAVGRLRDHWPPLGKVVDLVNLRPWRYPPLDRNLRSQLELDLPGEVAALRRLDIDASCWLERPPAPKAG